MPLLNYTTSVSVEKTVGEIQRILADHGARSMLVEYDNDRRICALAFQVDGPLGSLSIKLPVKPCEVHRVLNLQFERCEFPNRSFTHLDHAHRVAWRILKDWVEAQMAILETEMVHLAEIFLPYVIAPSGQTIFEVVMERNLLGSGQ